MSAPRTIARLDGEARRSLGNVPARVGLLGGSFNPAHEGHRHVSVEAMRRLGLDRIWWLVSPQNPLKAADGMNGLAARLASARSIGAHPRILATDIERSLGTRFTVDTVAALRRAFPKTRFVWLAGADILGQLPRWKRWPDVLAALPLAILDRPGHAGAALAGQVARRYARQRVAPERARDLAGRDAPAWTFIRCRLNAQSATALRAHRADR